MLPITVSWFLSCPSMFVSLIYHNAHRLKDTRKRWHLIRICCKLSNVSWSSLWKFRMKIKIQLQRCFKFLNRWRGFCTHPPFFSFEFLKDPSNPHWFHIDSTLIPWSISLNCNCVLILVNKSYLIILARFIIIRRIDLIFRVNVMKRCPRAKWSFPGHFVVNAENNRLSIDFLKMVFFTLTEPTPIHAAVLLGAFKISVSFSRRSDYFSLRKRVDTQKKERNACDRMDAVKPQLGSAWPSRRISSEVVLVTEGLMDALTKHGLCFVPGTERWENDTEVLNAPSNTAEWIFVGPVEKGDS